MNKLPVPKEIIAVNGQKSKNPITDILHFKFTQELKFDATSSIANSSNITSYFWDFGDGQSKEGAKQTHSYKPGASQVFPLVYVEIVDQNEVANSSQSNANTSAAQKVGSQIKNLLKFAGAGASIIVLLVILVKMSGKRRK